MKERISGGTRKLRGKLVFGAMGLLTPKFLKEINDWQNLVDRVPRPFTKFLKEHAGEKQLVGVEIGFGHGLNAKSMLEELPIKRLFCVDPVKPYDQFDGHFERYADTSKWAFNPNEDRRVSFLKMTSDEAFASGKLPRGDIDFFYVDGLHDTPQAYKDVMNAFDFVKVGGIVGGHDFTQHFQASVVPAVFKVSAETGLIPTIEIPDFWFIKNAKISE